MKLLVAIFCLVSFSSPLLAKAPDKFCLAAVSSAVEAKNSYDPHIFELNYSELITHMTKAQTEDLRSRIKYFDPKTTVEITIATKEDIQEFLSKIIDKTLAVSEDEKWGKNLYTLMLLKTASMVPIGYFLYLMSHSIIPPVGLAALLTAVVPKNLGVFFNDQVSINEIERLKENLELTSRPGISFVGRNANLSKKAWTSAMASRLNYANAHEDSYSIQIHQELELPLLRWMGWRGNSTKDSRETINVGTELILDTAGDQPKLHIIVGQGQNIPN